jgi:hypothetical protein
MTSKYFKVGVAGLLFTTHSALFAYADTDLEQRVKAFKKDPQGFATSQDSVQKYLRKYKTVGMDDETGEPILKFVSEKPCSELTGQDACPPSKFSPSEIQDGTFISKKNSYHEALQVKGADKIEEALRNKFDRHGREGINKSVDNPENLGKVHYWNLESMERAGLKQASLKMSPWSDDYWPIYRGILAWPFSNPNAPQTSDWSVINEFVMNKQNSSSIENLSPAQKYDLLLGVMNNLYSNDESERMKSLTYAMLAEGGRYYKENDPDSVEKWMGICHGWAAAAYMEKRPKHYIEVLAYDGKTKIPFYPSEIKALASLLWAHGQSKSNFVGSRCNKKLSDLNIDTKTGRADDPACRDTNPGTWHLAVVNQIGYYKRSFIIDATFDYQVWNQPVYAYDYRYFNPKTGKEVDSLAAAKVKRADFGSGDDIFHQYRSPDTDSIVGVEMTLTYIAETRPTTQLKDKEKLDRRVAVKYLYDLELDKNGRIIGGEWLLNRHPDFLWSPPADTIAQTDGDEILTSNNDKASWKNREKRHIPDSWRDAAINYSSPKGQPLGRIVKELVQKSNQAHFWLFGKRNHNQSGSGDRSDRY